MATYTATFLSRDDNGQFTNRHIRMGGVEHHDNMLSYITHGHHHGKWSIEGPITVRGPIGHQANTEVTYQV